MALALFKTKPDPNRPTKVAEQLLSLVGFSVFKFNNRPRPSRDKVLIISCFSEFGCETIGCMYCIPRLLKRFPGRYIIAMGWYGRDYLYRHLVDEFWEIEEKYMWLKDHCYAFHHISSNLKNIEKAAAIYGAVIPSSLLGRFAISNYCKTCGKTWNEWRVPVTACPTCQSTVLVPSIFGDVARYKKTALRIPLPNMKIDIEPNTVGIFARNRKTYGRNMPSAFYIKLIDKLFSLGYKVIWLGEKQSTLHCPVAIPDFSSERDLEKTLAIISKLKFTIQLWTASSRLSGMVGTPFLLVESPDQLTDNKGQEGKRLELTTFGPKKIVISHFLTFQEDMDFGLKVISQAIEELEEGNYMDLVINKDVQLS